MPSKSHVFMYHFMVITAGCQIMAKCQFGLKKGPRGLILPFFYIEIWSNRRHRYLFKEWKILGNKRAGTNRVNESKYHQILHKHWHTFIVRIYCVKIVFIHLSMIRTKNVSHIFNGYLHEIDIFQHCEILCETTMQVHMYGTKLKVRLAS
jgi:hypothetical protein